MTTANTQPQQKKIEDLSLHDFDMCYSLSRTGWSYADIGRRYQISETDVKTLVQGYVELRELFKAKPVVDSQDPNSGPELKAKKPRKRRCDAKYATAKDRQAAYRARLRDNRHADGQQPSRADETDKACQADEQLSVTARSDIL